MRFTDEERLARGAGGERWFDDLNRQARRATLLAFREAQRCQHDFVGTKHLLFGLLCDSGGWAARLLHALGATYDSLLGDLQGFMEDEEGCASLEQFPLSPAVRRAFDAAGKEARLQGLQLIGEEHLLLGLLHEPESEGAIVLAGFGIDLVGARRLLA